MNSRKRIQKQIQDQHKTLFSKIESKIQSEMDKLLNVATKQTQRNQNSEFENRVVDKIDSFNSEITKLEKEIEEAKSIIVNDIDAVMSNVTQGINHLQKKITPANYVPE